MHPAIRVRFARIPTGAAENCNLGSRVCPFLRGQSDRGERFESGVSLRVRRPQPGRVAGLRDIAAMTNGC